VNRILDEQQRRNRRSQNAWQAYAGHRERVTRLLVEAACGPQPALCVLGAGNCNDLDLVQLAARFPEIHLCDSDSEALAYGIAAQGLAASDRLHVHGGVELSGVAPLLADWSPEHPPDEPTVVQCALQASAATPLTLESRVAVATSVCLLSQLLEAVTSTLRERHPAYLRLLTAVRRRHLELLLELTQPGGAVVLVTDFVSAATFPGLPAVDERQLPQLTAQLIQQRNFFSGLNPFVLHRLFRTDPALAGQVSDVRLCRPWLWHFPARTYAVTAIIARKIACSMDVRDGAGTSLGPRG
jgi:hypothetical protein